MDVSKLNWAIVWRKGRKRRERKQREFCEPREQEAKDCVSQMDKVIQGRKAGGKEAETQIRGWRDWYGVGLRSAEKSQDSTMVSYDFGGCWGNLEVIDLIC